MVGRLRRHWRLCWLAAICVVYLSLACYQLGLPGLHYDEAKEAGVNALELLSGTPVTAFRDATIDLLGRRLPLMVQDYIGALNVYLAIPLLAATGVGVPNLRLLPVLTGLAALLLLERTVSEWCALAGKPGTVAPDSISLAGLISLTLLAASPSFVFWSRQGIFVTNLTQPLCLWCIWQGLRWLRLGRGGALMSSALAGGLALYTKLLAIWLVGPFVVLAGGWWLLQRRVHPQRAPHLSPRLAALTLLAFLVPLAPLVIFNLQTGGTFTSLAGNLQHSYYGVDNRAWLHNLVVRTGQLWQVLRGEQFWYLGGSYSNRLAPWIASMGILAGIIRRPRYTGLPVLLLLSSVLLSGFTISDLFITHYALLQPVMVGIVGIGLSSWANDAQQNGGDSPVAKQDPTRRFHMPFAVVAISLAVVSWFGLDLMTTIQYHGALAASGGLSSHSDATYHLAYYLQYHGLGAPIALDWGIDAPVRFLSRDTVTPIEIFGYASVAEPDAGFAQRLELFLSNPDNVYVLHAPAQTVFAGRRKGFLAQAAARGLTPVLVREFAQRDGTPLFELWRVRSAP